MARSHEEDDFQMTVMAYLDRVVSPLDAWYFHPPNGGNRSAREGGRFKKMGVKAGVADIVFLLPDSHTAMLELKSAKGVPSPSQRVFRATCERLLIPYGIAKTLEEVEAFIISLGIVPKFTLRGFR